jgi:hypothetical protein
MPFCILYCMLTILYSLSLYFSSLFHNKFSPLTSVFPLFIYSTLLPQIGTFAETTNVHYHLSFANQGRQIFVFRSQKTNGKLPFPFFVRNKRKLPFSNSLVFRIYIYIYILNETEAQAIFLDPFTVC